MAPQPLDRGDERALDGSPLVHQIKPVHIPIEQKESSSSSFSFNYTKDYTRRSIIASRRNNDRRPQTDANANVTANFTPNGNSKSKSKSKSNNSTPAVTSNPPPFTIVRNNDPRVVYFGPWSLSGNMFFTTHSTTSSGSSVSLKFNGTSIVVFGTVPASNETVAPPTAVFKVDAGDPVQTSAPTASKPISNQPIFAAGQLANEEHTINITILKAEAPFTLESFFIPNISNDITATNGTATSTDPTDSPSDVSAPYTSPSKGKTQSSSRSDHTGLKVLAAILGSVLALIIFAAAIFLFLRRRRARRSQSNRETVFTSFTSPESIVRANPSIFWASSDGRSEFRSDGRMSYMTQTASSPPPLPPKALLP